ncbi:hypothetical protein [Maribacter sp. 2307ULW6-5]|uniref:hypothetical protein n=1 Tax=Maribacter sp. 2307ULW6-5 TaxID=3386275 RepID=UPI0039BC2707
MNLQQRTRHLYELSQIFSLGMHHYINVAHWSTKPVLIHFFEQRAHERMAFVDELQQRLRAMEAAPAQEGIGEMLRNWQEYCGFHSLEQTFFITNDVGFLDNKALEYMHILLKRDLSEDTHSLLMSQLMRMETGILAFEQIRHHLRD